MADIYCLNSLDKLVLSSTLIAATALVVAAYAICFYKDSQLILTELLNASMFSSSASSMPSCYDIVVVRSATSTTLPYEYIMAFDITPPIRLQLLNVPLSNIADVDCISPLNVPSYMFSGFARITLYGVMPSFGLPGIRRIVRFSLRRMCRSV